jgi:beta-mannosidase
MMDSSSPKDPLTSQNKMAERRVIPIDKGWVFRQTDNKNSQFLPVAQFPTNVHLDLMHHGIIPDPFVGKNENDVQWVGEKAWVYRTTFATPTLKEGEKAVLAFEGLDTYATVLLNGEVMLKTENMFVPERVDVTRHLQDRTEENHLEITFESAFLIGMKMKERHPEHYWGCWNGNPSRLAVRKAQYHYVRLGSLSPSFPYCQYPCLYTDLVIWNIKGWDWGPTLMTCGPWRPINLELYSARISDLYFKVIVAKSLKQAHVVVKAEVEGDAEDMIFRIFLDGEEKGSAITQVLDGFADATFCVQDPELWYPSGYGKQPLYLVKATLRTSSINLDSCDKRLGLRRAELIQRELNDREGKTFFFEINNIPIFCGGSNWIPADNFIPRIGPEKYRDWIKLMVEGNQVMVRAWGGGVFEEKAFYDACDELGLLVWQDFLFACGTYPIYPEFLESVKREAIANIKLLRHHPSIVILAGNNEDYQYAESEELEYDPKDQDPNHWLKSSFPARYIYEKLLADVTRELIPDTYYHYGSPWGGKTTRDPTMGDIHQWQGVSFTCNFY